MQRRLPVLLVAAIRQVRASVEGGARAEVAALREEQIKEELGVQAPISRVVVDEDGGDSKRACRVWRGGGGDVDWKRKRASVRGVV